jgi:hypothetical protein
MLLAVKLPEFEQKWKSGSVPKDVWMRKTKVNEKRIIGKCFEEAIFGLR